MQLVGVETVYLSVCLSGFVSSRNAPERRSGPIRHIAAKFRFHLSESDKFALFGSKMPSASGGLRPPYPMTRGSAPGPRWGHRPQTPIGSRSRAHHILSVPLLFLTGNEPCCLSVRGHLLNRLRSLLCYSPNLCNRRARV